MGVSEENQALRTSATKALATVFSLKELMRAGVQTAIDSISSQAEAVGGRLSFDEAFTLHHRAVFATARAIVRDPAVAEEITQEVFLKLYRHFDSKPADDLLKPWLLRVTLNEARNTLRGQNRSQARDAVYQKESGETVAQIDYEQKQQVEAVRRALDKIKEPMRSCLLLKHQGLSYREIAQTLALKENYVGSLVARGRKEFARRYGKIGVKP